MFSGDDAMSSLRVWLVVGVCFLPSSAFGSLVMILTSGSASPGDPVDVYDAALTPTTYSGTWSESISGASGTWTVDFTDTSAAGTTGFVTSPRVVDLAEVPGGQGLQFHFDANTGGNGPERASLIDFSYTVNNLGSAAASDFGSAVALGPHGGGFNDNDGGFITDSTGSIIANHSIHDGPLDGTPVYNAATGHLDSLPETGSVSSSVNHDWTIAFAGTTSISRDGSFDDTDTIVFGIASFVTAPEPSSAVLLGFAGILGVFRRRRRG